MATIRDVAEDAGVSTTTVSRYLNRRIELPAATAGRIDAAVARLDYRPNSFARRLSMGRTETLAFVMPRIDDPRFAEIAAGVEDEAARLGYTALLLPAHGERTRELAALDRLADRDVDGLILMTDRPDDGSLARHTAGRGAIVLVGEDLAGIEAPRILVDDAAGAYAATHELIAAGHRLVGHIGGPEGLPSADARRAGFLDAMADAGLGVRREHVHSGTVSPETGREAARAFLRTATPPTAIFAAGAPLAAGAVRALRAAGLAVPADISLIGFGDMPLFDLLDPPLTTIREPLDAMGRAAVAALFEAINGRRSPPLARLPVTLIERNSVAPPRALP